MGVFGGTFDPPHLGHLVLAAEAAHQLGLERVLWVLTPDPPHKQDRSIISLELRLEMLQAALGGAPGFQISMVDIDRSPPHYALDTVCLLQEQYPRTELIYLVGGDSLHDLPAWHKPQELLEACHTLGVMRRPGEEPDLHHQRHRPQHPPGPIDRQPALEGPVGSRIDQRDHRRSGHLLLPQHGQLPMVEGADRFLAERLSAKLFAIDPSQIDLAASAAFFQTHIIVFLR